MNRTNKARSAFNEQLRHRIRIVMAIDNVRRKELAKMTQLSSPLLNQLMDNHQAQPKLGRVAKICEALNFDFDAIIGPKALFARRITKRVLAS